MRMARSTRRFARYVELIRIQAAEKVGKGTVGTLGTVGTVGNAPGDTDWDPRRVAALTPELPQGTTPPGTRGRILQAALGRFAANGFAGTSIRQIAADAGINSATLYAHYRSKEHILAELVMVGHRELHASLTGALAAVPENAGPAAALAALVRAHVLVHADFPLLSVVTNSELHALSQEAAAPALALREASRLLLIDVLERGRTSGEFSVPDILLAATAIGGMGMQVGHWFGPDQPYSREQVADEYARFALAIAGVPRPTPAPAAAP